MPVGHDVSPFYCGSRGQDARRSRVVFSEIVARRAQQQHLHDDERQQLFQARWLDSLRLPRKIDERQRDRRIGVKLVIAIVGLDDRFESLQVLLETRVVPIRTTKTGHSMQAVDYHPSDGTDDQTGRNRRQRDEQHDVEIGETARRGRQPPLHFGEEVAQSPQGQKARQDIGDHQAEVGANNVGHRTKESDARYVTPRRSPTGSSPRQ